MIEIKNLTKKYADKTVLDNLNLTFEKGKITAILGESGSGKTTLLNILANHLDYQGEVIKKSDNISVVFQKDRLIKNLTVRENLKLINEELDVESELEKVGILEAIDFYPKDLSAGMARRVAIVRAITYKADILLLDEPFINIDLSRKFTLIDSIKSGNEKTIIFVTHDIKEAVAMADRIVVLRKGRVVCDIDKVEEKTESELFGLMMDIEEL